MKNLLFLLAGSLLFFSCVTAESALQDAEYYYMNGKYYAAINKAVQSYEIALEDESQEAFLNQAKDFLLLYYDEAITFYAQEAEKKGKGTESEILGAPDLWYYLIQFNQKISTSPVASFLSVKDFSTEYNESKEIAGNYCIAKAETKLNGISRKDMISAFDYAQKGLEFLPYNEKADSYKQLAAELAALKVAIVYPEITYRSSKSRLFSQDLIRVTDTKFKNSLIDLVSNSYDQRFLSITVHDSISEAEFYDPHVILRMDGVIDGDSGKFDIPFMNRIRYFRSADLQITLTTINLVENNQITNLYSDGFEQEVFISFPEDITNSTFTYLQYDDFNNYSKLNKEYNNAIEDLAKGNTYQSEFYLLVDKNGDTLVPVSEIKTEIGLQPLDSNLLAIYQQMIRDMTSQFPYFRLFKDENVFNRSVIQFKTQVLNDSGSGVKAVCNQLLNSL